MTRRRNPTSKSTRSRSSNAKPRAKRPRSSSATNGKNRGKRPARKPSSNRGPTFRLPTIPQREVCGLLLIAFGAILLFSLIAGAETNFTANLVLLVRRVVGWGAALVALCCIGLGVMLLLFPTYLQRVNWRRVVGGEILILSVLSLAHLRAAANLNEAAALLTVATRGEGGGYVAWVLTAPLVDAVGRGGTVFIYLGTTLASAVMAFNLSRESVRRGHAALLALLRRVSASMALAELRTQIDEGRAIARQRQISPNSVSPSPEQAKVTALPTARKQAPVIKSRATAQENAKSAARPRARDKTLPPLTLLNRDTTRPFSARDVRRQSAIIEQTLASFNVPTQVREVHQGPTVTRYSLEPGYIERKSRRGAVSRRKIRVSKITALADDLALALAAAPIRIEAPIPGKPYVGIEVPNRKVEVASLRGVLESAAFTSIKSNLRIALGRDVSGAAIATDLAKMPHLLVAGATGSGKSVCLNAIIASLLYENHPHELQLLMIDPKRVELVQYNGIPHLLAPVVVELESVVDALHEVVTEMQQRYKIFSEARVRDIARYNKKSDTPIPYIVVLVDELADLMMLAPVEIEQAICRIAQMSRATGIHLVISTQRPSVDVITGLIKANFPARIAFATTSQTDSRVILDTGGAEKLLGRGDMLFMSPDSSALLRLQGCYISDGELRKLIKFWKNHKS